MKRKICDMAEHLDSQFLEELEFSHAELKELTKDVDFQRAQRLMTAGVQANGQQTTNNPAPNVIGAPQAGNNNHEKQHKKISKRFGLVRRTAAVAAVIGVLVCGTAYAVQKGYLEEWLGFEKNLPQGQITRVNDSQLDGGVEMKLTDVLNGGQEALAVVTFQCQDGQPFDPDGRLSLQQMDLTLDGEKINHSLSWGLSEDNKTLRFQLHFTGEEDLLGKTIDFQSQGITASYEPQADYAGDLAQIYQSAPFSLTAGELQTAETTGITEAQSLADSSPDSWSGGAVSYFCANLQQQPPALPLAEQYPAATFLGLGFVDETLVFAVRSTDPINNGAAEGIGAWINQIKDSRTGEAVYSHGMHFYPQADGSTIYLTRFHGWTAGDLPYLSAVAEYQEQRTVSTGVWGFRYTVTEPGVVKTAKLDQTFDSTAGRNHYSQLELNLLGMNIYGQWLAVDGQEPASKGAVSEVAVAKLILRDGTEVPLEKRSSHISGEEDFVAHYVIPAKAAGQWGQYEDDNQTYLDKDLMEQIQAVDIGGILTPIN